MADVLRGAVRPRRLEQLPGVCRVLAGTAGGIGAGGAVRGGLGELAA